MQISQYFLDIFFIFFVIPLFILFQFCFADGDIFIFISLFFFCSFDLTSVSLLLPSLHSFPSPFPPFYHSRLSEDLNNILYASFNNLPTSHPPSFSLPIPSKVVKRKMKLMKGRNTDQIGLEGASHISLLPFHTRSTRTHPTFSPPNSPSSTKGSFLPHTSPSSQNIQASAPIFSLPSPRPLPLIFIPFLSFPVPLPTPFSP